MFKMVLTRASGNTLVVPGFSLKRPHLFPEPNCAIKDAECSISRNSMTRMLLWGVREAGVGLQ